MSSKAKQSKESESGGRGEGEGKRNGGRARERESRTGATAGNTRHLNGSHFACFVLFFVCMAFIICA